MFVRWQLYESKAQDETLRERRHARDARLKAILVESARVDGKPRQKHVAFLGSTCIDGGDRVRFWRKVTRVLERLDNRVTAPERERILAAIRAKVGEPPTENRTHVRNDN
jgi:hypothetical protein